mmetsp:Transcript_2682/g.10648  ORF Transcript_2682/g.10648 Transcript_2682/m.10648 type:complete len:287 (+) Transcript_2682:600-1460(+)
MTTFAAAATISAGCGGAILWNLNPPLRSMLGIAHSLRGVQSVTHTPVAPPRPVRPDRWMYVSASFGGSHCTTSSTPEMSSPRAATSVATSVWNLLARNPARTTSRCDWFTSPCSALAPFLSSFCSASESSPQSRLVSQKTITLPSPGTFARIRSHTSSVRSDHWHGISMCVTESLALRFSSPTRSTVACPADRNRRAMSATHFGRVAENSSVCRLVLSFAAFKMVSMSSTKPMFNISSASSKTRNRRLAKESVLRSRWSFMRPGVPTTMSHPARSARSCSPYGAPP